MGFMTKIGSLCQEWQFMPDCLQAETEALSSEAKISQPRTTEPRFPNEVFRTHKYFVYLRIHLASGDGLQVRGVCAYAEHLAT